MPHCNEPLLLNNLLCFGHGLGQRMQFSQLKRREFIMLLGGVAAWPLAAHAQQARERVRRIGGLFAITADDPEAQARVAAFAQGLQQSGWTIGQNVRVEYRFAGINHDDLRRNAVELVALAPDVILSQSSGAIAPLLQATRTIPIVFTTVADPVGAGFVDSLARPGGNATGFTNFEYGIAAKWLELLKEIAPGVTRAAILRESAIAAGPAQFGVIQAVASSLGVELRPIDIRDAAGIEQGITAFAQQASNGGMIVTGSPAAVVHRKLIAALAARHRLPAVYNSRYFVTDGGLISYGFDAVDQFRRAAQYVDRTLKGEKPANLPVQATVKYELLVNLKAAKVLGLDLLASVLARADEVIE
jgi:putative ABC transport system substrate-binding protein